MTKTFKVMTEGDCEGKTIRTLGYATGDPTDIKIFYDDLKYYKIRVEEIEIVQVDQFTVAQKRKLLKKKESLESERSNIDKELKELGEKL